MKRRLIRALVIFFVGVLVAAAAGGMWARAQLRSSLPQLDGELKVPGLSAPVTIARDALGVPTIHGRSREDVARATGILHAQDRFFQMDLARRRAAGELSALVGPRALDADREMRPHRFRAEAQRALAALPGPHRVVLDAYVAGVNAGLAALDARPFEYILLRQRPAPWRTEDSLLVVLSMFVTLQESDGAYESTLGTIHDVLPPEMAAFIDAPGTEWDSPVVGEAFATPAFPGKNAYDLRERRKHKPPIDLEVRRAAVGPPADAAIGSNSWVVAGRLTATGGALVANDMHLTVRVPNTWYRAVLEWPGHRLAGITLPGVPSLVAGSNSHVAWGFTNTYADWSDIVLLDVDPSNPERYRTADGWRQFERYDEVIEVAGSRPEREEVRWTMWGPVIGPDYRGRLRAYRWVAHSAEQLARRGLTPIESATTVEEAFDQANDLGAPGQNMVVADRTGRIGWTVYGSIPRRSNLDGALPSSWADGSRGWSGWLSPAEYPRLIDPAGGRIWTANARVVDGDMLARLGDGSYEVGSRARIIRDVLAASDRFTAADMVRLQLDARAVFLARWRDLMLRTLTPGAVRDQPARARLREILERDWTGEASPESAAYRFTRVLREEISDAVLGFVVSECYEADPSFDHRTLRRREGPVWKLLAEQPHHLLDPRYASWDALVLAAVDRVIERTAPDGDLSARTWAEYNVNAYRHPLSAGLPLVSRWLDMPVVGLPGDLFTPRVHWRGAAASERMVVSPGRESEGFMQMPAGQSGHPLSEFYASSHEAWVKGEPTPFLPGPERHRLTLAP